VAARHPGSPAGHAAGPGGGGGAGIRGGHLISPATLEFEPLNCSLGTPLGDYYQDVSAAIVLVESGYHGAFDNGVPLVEVDGYGLRTSAVVVAQYALANLIAAARGEHERTDRARAQLDWLVAAQERLGPLDGLWVTDYDNPKYKWLRAPWTSAMASGNAISALLRGAEQLGDERYRDAAEHAYRALHGHPELGLVLDDGTDLWYEEYPAEPPLHVLNGHIYALLGVVDIARVTADPVADSRWRRAATTAIDHLGDFDLGYWSAYDSHFRSPVSAHYHRNIHIPLLRILAELTGDGRASAVADRWEGYLRSPIARVRYQVALRADRWRKSASVRPAAVGPGATDDAVSLRPFPYPYRAGLALCNDADSLTPATFRQLYRYLTTEEDTEWGTGLGMPVGGSFFMFRSPDSPNAFTVFDRLSTTVTEDGEYILECVERGVLDVLHTYGCFTAPDHFKRPLAEVAVETLRDRGISVETWVNHGDPQTNVQCLGSRDEWQGDLAGTPAYHADLTLGYGFRWVWTGTEITDEIALDGDLIQTYALRDGQLVRRFWRYGGLDGNTPVLDDLPRQLASDNLDRLVEAGGCSIVYQHLAVRRVKPGFGPGVYGPVGPGWFRPAELAALQGLARRYHEGQIWVAPTTSLLRYHDVHSRLRWRSERLDEHDAIVITDDGSDLSGITFYCERPSETRVYLETQNARELIEEARPNPADASGRPSITVQPLREPLPLP
jgi:hypothetical protein